MFSVQYYNTLAKKGLDLLTKNNYILDANTSEPDAILLRSHKLHDMTINDQLKVIARAGAGTNNIPIKKLQSLGIPVLNTPGANANAVKELVISALFIASRNVCQAWEMTKQLKGNDIEQQVEQLKKQFSGIELAGKKLGIIGLGAIGVQVANAAEALGMIVIAYDPHITVDNAWQLSAMIQHAHTLDALLPDLDFLTIHVPLNEQTTALINHEKLCLLPSKCSVLNFARAPIVDSKAILALLNDEKLNYYITDFPDASLIQSDRVIALPHLGASTLEAEDNCALMAVSHLKEFLELGNIRHSVNFPNISLTKSKGYRLTITNKNIPSMVSKISNLLANNELNIINMINKSRDDIAYSIFDVDGEITETIKADISAIEGIINCRVLT